MADEMIELCKTVLLWISSDVKLYDYCYFILTNSGFGELGRCQLSQSMSKTKVWASEKGKPKCHTVLAST